MSVFILIAAEDLVLNLLFINKHIVDLFLLDVSCVVTIDSVFGCEQESFINISMPKIDKDYSLHRTYVIFRTLGLRHFVVVDVHNHVVGIITRKDLMPFRMQERLESLLELKDSLNDDGGGCDANCDLRPKSTDNVEVTVCLHVDKNPPDFDESQSSRRHSLPTTRLSVNKMTLGGLQETDEVDSTASPDAGHDDNSETAVQTVVSVQQKHSKQHWV